MGKGTVLVVDRNTYEVYRYPLDRVYESVATRLNTQVPGFSFFDTTWLLSPSRDTLLVVPSERAAQGYAIPALPEIGGIPAKTEHFATTAIPGPPVTYRVSFDGSAAIHAAAPPMDAPRTLSQTYAFIYRVRDGGVLEYAYPEVPPFMRTVGNRFRQFGMSNNRAYGIIYANSRGRIINLADGTETQTTISLSSSISGGDSAVSNDLTLWARTGTSLDIYQSTDGFVTHTTLGSVYAPYHKNPVFGPNNSIVFTSKSGTTSAIYRWDVTTLTSQVYNNVLSCGVAPNNQFVVMGGWSTTAPAGAVYAATDLDTPIAALLGSEVLVAISPDSTVIVCAERYNPTVYVYDVVGDPITGVSLRGTIQRDLSGSLNHIIFTSNTILYLAGGGVSRTESDMFNSVIDIQAMVNRPLGSLAVQNHLSDYRLIVYNGDVLLSDDTYYGSTTGMQFAIPVGSEFPVPMRTNWVPLTGLLAISHDYVWYVRGQELYRLDPWTPAAPVLIHEFTGNIQSMDANESGRLAVVVDGAVYTVSSDDQVTSPLVSEGAVASVRGGPGDTFILVDAANLMEQVNGITAHEHSVVNDTTGIRLSIHSTVAGERDGQLYFRPINKTFTHGPSLPLTPRQILSSSKSDPSGRVAAEYGEMTYVVGDVPYPIPLPPSSGRDFALAPYDVSPSGNRILAGTSAGIEITDTYSMELLAICTQATGTLAFGRFLTEDIVCYSKSTAVTYIEDIVTSQWVAVTGQHKPIGEYTPGLWFFYNDVEISLVDINTGVRTSLRTIAPDITRNAVSITAFSGVYSGDTIMIGVGLSKKDYGGGTLRYKVVPGAPMPTLEFIDHRQAVSHYIADDSNGNINDYYGTVFVDETLVVIDTTAGQIAVMDLENHTVDMYNGVGSREGCRATAYDPAGGVVWFNKEGTWYTFNLATHAVAITPNSALNAWDEIVIDQQGQYALARDFYDGFVLYDWATLSEIPIQELGGFDYAISTAASGNYMAALGRTPYGTTYRIVLIDTSDLSVVLNRTYSNNFDSLCIIETPTQLQLAVFTSSRHVMLIDGVTGDIVSISESSEATAGYMWYRADTDTIYIVNEDIYEFTRADLTLVTRVNNDKSVDGVYYSTQSSYGRPAMSGSHRFIALHAGDSKRVVSIWDTEAGAPLVSNPGARFGRHAGHIVHYNGYVSQSDVSVPMVVKGDVRVTPTDLSAVFVEGQSLFMGSSRETALLIHIEDNYAALVAGSEHNQKYTVLVEENGVYHEAATAGFPPHTPYKYWDAAGTYGVCVGGLIRAGDAPEWIALKPLVDGLEPPPILHRYTHE